MTEREESALTSLLEKLCLKLGVDYVELFDDYLRDSRETTRRTPMESRVHAQEAEAILEKYRATATELADSELQSTWELAEYRVRRLRYDVQMPENTAMVDVVAALEKLRDSIDYYYPELAGDLREFKDKVGW